MIQISDIIILTEVYEDIERGFLFYKSQEAWIADYFFDSILADIESLRIYAGTHKITNNHFRMLCHNFPFAVYYDIQDDIAVVIAVLDVRANPISIKNSLGNRR